MGAKGRRQPNEPEETAGPEGPVWLVFGSWRGSPKLLAHTARRVEEYADGSTSLKISVDLEDDSEVFESADEFLAHVTSEALRQFSAIQISAGDASDRRVVVHLQRRQYRPDQRDEVAARVWTAGSEPPPMLPRAGALIYVEGTQASAKRDELKPTLKRGSKFRLRSAPVPGPTKDLQYPGQAVQVRGRLTDFLGGVVAALLTIAATIAASGFRLGTVPRCSDSTPESCHDTLRPEYIWPPAGGIWVAGGVAVLAFAVAVLVSRCRLDRNLFFWLWPPVEVADQTVVRGLLKRALSLVPAGAFVAFLGQAGAKLLGAQ